DENEAGLNIDLDNLSRSLQTADIRPFDIRRRSCRLGIHNHNCALLDLERLKAAEEYLKSGDSPGKRDSQQTDDEDDLLPQEDIGSFEVTQGLDDQKQALLNLKQLLKELKPYTENIPTIKKDCRFRLGGHCLTESLDRAANQYYYLKSPNSPGRRRRDVSSTSSQE
ncbi:unnamed protein product, partial [Candidula unifasciata]